MAITKRWQLKSVMDRSLFDMVKDPDAITWLSTVELPYIGLPELGINVPVQYETCLFEAGGDSKVLEKYHTKAAAIKGHEHYRIKYRLKDTVEASI